VANEENAKIMERKKPQNMEKRKKRNLEKPG